jgi:ligand-binding sensor domain-containing protein
MARPLFIIIGFLLACSLSGVAQTSSQSSTRYGSESWQTEQGLPQNSVHCIRQTRDGYLWLGTREGLARFDGVRFTIFDRRTTPTFLHNQIRHLLEDRAGILWISTPAALVRYRAGQFTSFTTKDGLASDNVWSTYEDRAGNLWVATLGGLSRYRDGKFSSYTIGAIGNVECLLEDRDGALWIGTTDGLVRWANGTFTTFTKQHGLAGNAIKALFQDQQGRLWIATTEGLSRWSEGRFTNAGLPPREITSFAQDRASKLWVGTTDGLYEERVGRFIRYPLPDNRITTLYADRVGDVWAGTASGLHSVGQVLNLPYSADGRKTVGQVKNLPYAVGNAVLAIYEDREGNLWSGTDGGGLHVLRQVKFNTFTTQQGLGGNVIRSVYEDRAGNVWVATQEGGVSKFSAGRWTTRANLPSKDVMSVSEDRAGDLWFGTTNGLVRQRGNVRMTYTTRDGLPDDYIRSLYADRAGRLWIGTRRGLARWQGGKFTSWSTLDGLPSDLIGALCESRDGSLWIGTRNGLSRFHNETFTNYDTRDTVLALHEDEAGNLWIGTLGSGLLRFCEGKFTAYTMKDGLPDDTIYHILEDDQQHLWMSSNKGIIRVSRLELEARAPNATQPLSLVTYTTADGLETRECSGGGHPAGCKTRDGKLWFATLKGVAVVDPARMPFNALPPPVAIEQLLVDDQPIAFNDTEQNIAAGAHRFEFAFTSLSFVAPHQAAFRYRLEGYDNDWLTTGGQRVISYTNLPSGRYRFRVQASNNDGVWNETGAALAFYLRPRFYETWWFAALVVASLALLGAAVYRLRMRRLAHDFDVVLAERARLAREIHDTLAQGFTALSLQLELVTRLIDRAPETAKTHLEQARALVRDSLAEARRTVWDLRSCNKPRINSPPAAT